VPPEDELLQRLARSSGLRVEEVRQLVELRVVAVGDGAVRPALLRRLRRVRRLRRDLGLSLDAVVIVVRLLDRIEVLEGVRARRRGVRVIDEPLP
jgi:DNA-binding transcriptional MerR regulator